MLEQAFQALWTDVGPAACSIAWRSKLPQHRPAYERTMCIGAFAPLATLGLGPLLTACPGYLAPKAH